MTQSKRGRPGGAYSKIANEAKRAVLMAFDAIGGHQRLADWIRADPANETLYWTRIFARLLPRPALDVEPEPKPRKPLPGVLTWKTPDWVKLLDRKEELLAAAGIGAVAAGEAFPQSSADGQPP